MDSHACNTPRDSFCALLSPPHTHNRRRKQHAERCNVNETDKDPLISSFYESFDSPLELSTVNAASHTDVAGMPHRLSRGSSTCLVLMPSTVPVPRSGV